MGLDMAQTVDYYAVGFGNKGNYGMHIFDIVAFVFDPTNASNVTVLDMYASQNGMPPTDVSLHGTSDYFLIDSYVVPGQSQVLFERKLNTGDPYDYIFDPSVTASTIVMSWAFNNAGEQGLTFHLRNAGTVSSPMYNGFQGVARSYFLGFISPELAFIIHGYVLLFGWGILIEIALEFGRYRKFSNYYLKVHLYTTSLLYFLTAVTSALAIYISKIFLRVFSNLSHRMGRNYHRHFTIISFLHGSHQFGTLHFPDLLWIPVQLQNFESSDN